MIEKYDLHSHSSYSDGFFSPTDLVDRARQLGVTALALTDHDTVDGLAEAKQAADAASIRLIAGIELSISWQNKSIHVVGLGVDPEHPRLLAATHQLAQVRRDRAEKIADKLEKKRVPGALDWVLNAAGRGMITRLHFADFLVSQHHVDTQQEAFDRYLSSGKAAYVATEWAELAEAVDWIKQAGGIAVVAHPMRYKLTANWMKRLLTAFRDAGGEAMEVVTGRGSVEEVRLLADYAKIFGLAGSVGSDFHSPKNQWVELGRLAPLPNSVNPVWALLN
jgi:3',5'-nucleoside bisphosphate phosphatase